MRKLWATWERFQMRRKRKEARHAALAHMSRIEKLARERAEMILKEINREAALLRTAPYAKYCSDEHIVNLATMIVVGSQPEREYAR